MSKGRMLVIGAGRMGHALAQVCALEGFEVGVVDSNAQSLAQAQTAVEEKFQRVVEWGLKSPADTAAARSRLSWHNSWTTQVAGQQLVLEAIPEDLALKQELFRQLDAACPPGVILATNTSSLRINSIAEACRYPGRVVGIHWVNPPLVVPVIEVISGPATAPETRQAALDFVRAVGKVPLPCQDQPGFLVNRLKAALVNEAIALLAEGVADAPTIDDAVRLGFAPRFALYGPLLANDLTGNKLTTLAVTSYLWQELGRPQFEPPALLQQKVAAGHLGIMSGRGWYDFSSLPLEEILTRRDAVLARAHACLAELEELSSLAELRSNDLGKLGVNL